MKYFANLFRRGAAAVLGTALAALTMVACVSDEQLVPGTGDSAENRQMVFRINVPAGTSHQTRAITEGSAADNAVGDLLFLMFGSNDKLLADTDGYRIVTTEKIKDTSDENAYTVKVEIPQGAVKALVVANWGQLEGTTTADYLVESLAGKTFSEVVADKSLFNYDAFPGDEDFTDDHAYHLMGSRPFDLSTATTAAIPLTRSLAKINITVSNNLTVVGNDDQGGQLTGVDGFKLKNIRLVNVNRHAQVFPPVSTTAGTMNDDTTDAFASGTLYDYIEYAAGNSTSFVDKIFLPETAISAALKTAEKTVAGQTAMWTDAAALWKTAPTLLIQATLKQGGTSVDRWFRVNLRMADTADGNRLKHVDLLRNHKYTVDITGIGGMGYPTADEAYEALPGDLIITLTAVADDELNDIVYNGQYYLATNGPAFEFDGQAHTDGLLKIFTNHPDGWKIESITGNTGWLTGADIVAGKEGAANVKAELGFALTKNTSGASREAIITITAGAVTAQIEITQDYIPTPNIIYWDDVSKTLQVGSWNAYDGGEVTQSNLLFFKFGSIIGFQAAESLTNATNDFDSGDIKFNPASDYTYTTWAKIPTWNTTNTTDGYISSDAYHRSVAIKLGRGDPCKLVGLTVEQIKAGTIDNGRFRLPTSAEQQAEGWSTYGGTYPSTNTADVAVGAVAATTGIFLPAAGCRNGGDGSSWYIGRTGYYWTSTATDRDYGQMLYFYHWSTSFVETSRASQINNGLPVRCVRVTP